MDGRHFGSLRRALYRACVGRRDGNTVLRPKLFVSLLLFAAATSTRAAGPTITIDAGSSSANVSRLFYGLMTEEINHSYDGGLYAELVRNRAFLDDAGSPAHWAAVQGDGAAAAIALDKSQPMNDTVPTSLRVGKESGKRGSAKFLLRASLQRLEARSNARLCRKGGKQGLRECMDGLDPQAARGF